MADVSVYSPLGADGAGLRIPEVKREYLYLVGGFAVTATLLVILKRKRLKRRKGKR